ncbi:beta-glucoside-specific PTS transporter subunit IIABC [Paenibacillus polymyxa]|uniref:beta-glucoside-specific PTS transporter subunit IIABC n=1 Tax=Paenibacillus polymyxa TaxID=1406 RepID=UPI002ED5B7F6|nr:beta-glucoside-specific PTS transporter subunit IIABC [Paenibacillus polymyxa]
MDYNKTAKDILHFVGGKNNVVHLGHCATRLRFTLADNRKANVEEIKKVNGVLDVVSTAQFQVVIGNSVMEVYDELVKIGNFGDSDQDDTKSNSNGTPKQKKKIGAVVLDFFVSVFQPLVPAMAGAGILKSILLLLSVLNLIDKTEPTYLILTYISGSVFYFLPVLVAITTASKLKVNYLVAAAAMSVLLFPDMIALIGDGASFMTLPVTSVNYASQVFPSMLGVMFYALMERFFFKLSPKPIRVFFVPMMSMLFTVPVTLLLLGPLGFMLGKLLTAGILFIFHTVGWIAVGILAALLPFMIATGMHKALTPYGISALAATGRETLLLPAFLAHNMSQSAACFAVAIRTRDSRLKSVAISSGISALFGISEPALYGVTLQRKRILISVIISCLIGGLSLGLLGVSSNTWVSPSLASFSMFIDPTNARNFIYAIVGLVISYVSSFVITMFLWREDKATSGESITTNGTAETGNVDKNTSAEVSIKQPVHGTVIPLAEVKDEVFSTKSMGEGIAVIPSSGELYAPADGKIKMVFRTQHAIAMETTNGVEMLFHIGIDTVKLRGQHFESQVKIGDEVKTGDLLVKFDLQKIIEAGYDPVTVTVVTNQDKSLVKVVDSTINDHQGTLMFVTAAKN